MTFSIFSLNAYKDNYIWVIGNNYNQLIIVDPGESKPVLEFLQQNTHLTISAIFITHKHWDHCHGVPDILENFTVPVYGPSTNQLNFITHPVRENDVVKIKGFPDFKVMEIPGHTLEHIAFYNNKVIFCGDTLFTGGCGRLFEGTPSQMLEALTKISQLPENILIYCGHEYTQKNLKFAKIIEPNNLDLLLRIKNCEELRSHHKPTVPSTLQLEKLTNPFLRCNQQEVIESVKKYYQKDFTEMVDIFAHLRNWKDGFQT